MEFEILEIPVLQFDKVHFYTIKKEGYEKSEFKDFQDKMLQLGKADPRVLNDLEQIKSEIILIGQKFGAEERRFKPERGAFALATNYPKRNNSDGIYGLRVYCLLVSEEIVILLNGGDKTAKTAQDCANVRMSFYEALHMQKRIDDYLKQGVLKKIGPFLVNEDEEPLLS